MYDSISELLQEIAAGEDTHLELKEVKFQGEKVRFANEDGRATAKIAEVFVSMANTDGGVVVFGVADNGDPVGVDPTKKGLLEQFVINCAHDACKPEIEIHLDWMTLEKSDGNPALCLKATIEKARYYVHQTSDGRFLKRVGSHRRPISAEELGRLLAARRLLIPFEERPSFGTQLQDLNTQLFDAYYRSRFAKSIPESGLPIERLLSNLKLAVEVEGEWKLTNLGVLLFTDQPQRHLNGAFVDIAVYDHDIADGNTRDARKIIGTIPEQIERTSSYLQTSPACAVVSEKNGVGRRDAPRYSAFALQEAVVNALIHRDYELDGAQVILSLFPNRLEIRNPGALHNTLTPENLFAGCQPIRRNQLLVGFMRDFPSPATQRSYVEGRGEGFLTLVRESERVSGRRPELYVDGQSVRLVIHAGDDE